MYAHLKQFRESEQVVATIARFCVAIVIATLAIAVIGLASPSTGLFLAYGELIFAVYHTLKLFVRATLGAVLIAIGYPGDRYDGPEQDGSGKDAMLGIVELAVLAASLYLLFGIVLKSAVL